MSPAVGVIVDPEDDLATTRAIRELAARELAIRVDAILNRSFMTMRHWRSQRVCPKRREIVSALRLISAADDLEHAYIRRAGAEMALIVVGRHASAHRRRPNH